MDWFSLNWHEASNQEKSRNRQTATTSTSYPGSFLWWTPETMMIRQVTVLLRVTTLDSRVRRCTGISKIAPVVRTKHLLLKIEFTLHFEPVKDICWKNISSSYHRRKYAHLFFKLILSVSMNITLYLEQ